MTHPSGSSSYSATYVYLANSPLVAQINFTNNGSGRMTTTKSYDFLNRLIAISSVGSGPSSLASFAYVYNSASQRTRVALADGSYWRYQYDALGQVNAGKKYWADQTPVAGQQFEYAFDDIGNRLSTKAGGDENGANLRPANYGANSLNQYTSRDVPAAFDVIGLELATNSVTVNTLTPYRKGEYFRKEITVSNGSGPVWESINVSAPNETPVTGHVFVPKTQEVFGYDWDGNLTSDGRWNYTWDAENRLITMAANASAGPQISLTFEYDSKSRRIRKQVWPNNTWSGSPTNDLRFVYDGWNLISTLTSQLSAINCFVWGLDLSGSMQGAGGVGGLLEVSGAASGAHFAAYDGNGNLAALVKAADGSSAATYEYGPFGEVLRATGPMAKASPFRFSTKYQDDETDLLYYGERFLKDGRWVSRDPIGERGGVNLYGFLQNAPTWAFDRLGLSSVFEVTADPPEYDVPNLTDWRGRPVSAVTERRFEVYSARAVYSGNAAKVTDIEARLKLQERFTMSQSASWLVTPPSLSAASHEDVHANIFITKAEMMEIGLQMIYNRWVCIPCYVAWTRYFAALNSFAECTIMLAHDNFDCSQGNRQACDDTIDDRMRLQEAQRLLIWQGREYNYQCLGR
jgi:RHS repeat-associated protein